LKFFSANGFNLRHFPAAKDWQGFLTISINQNKIFMKKVFFIAGIMFSLSTISISVQAQTTTTTKSRVGRNVAIGAGAGAVTGAVVSKKHPVQGAAIGAAAGAGVGYAYGRHRNKKKGRRVVVKHN
jgi:uncharacterized membrane protein